MVAMILFKIKLKCENQIKVNKSNPNIGLLLLDVLFLFFSFENPLETDTSHPDLISDCSLNGVGLTRLFRDKKKKKNLFFLSFFIRFSSFVFWLKR